MDYKVKDLNLAEAGRHQIRLAENEMPGLMALRKQYQDSKPLRGARITGSLHMTVQTAVLIETLVVLGAEVRWASCNIFSTQDEAAAAVVVGSGTVSNPAGVPVFAWKGETLEEYWWCTERILDWSSHPAAEGKTYFGPNMILDDGGDVTLLVHKGAEYETQGSVPSVAAGDSEEWQVVLELLKSLQVSQRDRFSAISKDIVGVSEETTTGVKRLYDFAQAGALLFPAVNVNDSATKSLFDNRIGTRESGLDAWKFGTAAQIAGKTVFVAGYGDVGKGVAAGFRGQGARVVVSEIDPICAIQAAMEGYQVVTIEDVLADADVFITTTGNTDIVTAEHIQQMKDKAVIFNVGHFDNEIQMAEIGQITGIKRTEIKPQVHEWILPSGKSVIILSEGRLANLGNATGHPSFVMSMSFTNQVLAQLALWNREFPLGVHILPKHLDEQVARLHLPHINAKLTTLTSKQAEYLGVNVDGPYKPNHYRY